MKIKNYTVFTDGRNFYVKSINDLIKKKDQSRKIVTGQGSDYARRCLLDYSYFKDNYQLIAVVDLGTQKHQILIQRFIQQTEFYGILKAKSEISMQKFYKRIYSIYPMYK